MAGRVKIHSIIRQVHRVSSMIILLYLLMWVFSGIILINRDLFNIPEREEEVQTISALNKIGDDPGEYAKALAEHYDFKGRIEYRQDWKKNWIFNYNFPGKWVTVTVPPSSDSIQIKTTTQQRTFFTTVQQMHVLRGFKGGWPYTVWAIFYDTACFALVLFVLTGFLMWFRMRKAYPLGWFFLGLGLAIPLVFAFLFLFWK